MYSVIVNSKLITFPCINLILFCIIITIHSYMYLIIDTHFVPCLL